MTQTISTRIAIMMLAVALQGCASLPPGSVPNPGDPWERYNRAAYSFNDTVDRAVLKPVAQAYKAVSPDVFRQAVGNFFGNLSDIPTAANDVLQGQLKQAATHVGRVVVNSTFGLLGLIDLATPMGMERQRADFGQTLGVWGLGSGPYLVLPLLGPSSVRDTAGLGVDYFTDPVLRLGDSTVREADAGLRVVDRRARVLAIEQTLKSIELDPYVFIRDGYLARRRNAVSHGDSSDQEKRGAQIPTVQAPDGSPETVREDLAPTPE
jgi:phospholipid-binding lipoprotein MlaA